MISIQTIFSSVSSLPLLYLVLSRMKQKLLELGANTIATLPKLFKSKSSYDGKTHVHVSDFFDGLSSYGLKIVKEEAVLICRFFDRDGTENIDFEEFLFALRGKPNEERQAVIDLVYSKVDKNHVGYAEATELRKVFNCVKHPRYLNGELSEDQIFYLYLKNFSNNGKGQVTKKEWDDYYAGISVAVDDDAHFIRLIKNQFKVE